MLRRGASVLSLIGVQLSSYLRGTTLAIPRARGSTRVATSWDGTSVLTV